MATNYTAQGSITIKRLRNGDSLFLVLETNGKPLYQGVDTDTGEVSPDWSVSANQPEITAKCSSVRGNTVTLTGRTWSWNSVRITFTGGDSTTLDGYIISTNCDNAFAYNTSTGGLRIIKNLASTTNYANDTINFTAVATVSGVEYSVTKDIDIIIAKAGASSYVGYITASTLQLSSTDGNTSTVLITTLFRGIEELTDYTVKWFKGSDETEVSSSDSTTKTLTVTRDMVDGVTLYIAEFHVDGNAVARYAVNITDLSDEYQVVYSISGSNQQISESAGVVVTGKVIRFPSGSSKAVEVSLDSTAVWNTEVYNGTSWKKTQDVAGNEVTVTTADSDYEDSSGNSIQSDVVVTGTVTW